MLLRGLLLAAAFACIDGGFDLGYGVKTQPLRLRGAGSAFAHSHGGGGLQKQRPPAIVTKVEELTEGETRPYLKREESRLVLSEVAPLWGPPRCHALLPHLKCASLSGPGGETCCSLVRPV